MRTVYLKAILAGTQESKAVHYISQHRFREDPHNHTIPIFDIVPFEEKNTEVMVMLAASTALSVRLSEFRNVTHLYDFVTQLLEVI